MVMRRKAGGFTLAEILITLVIIGFVGALGIPMLGQTKLKKPVEIKAAHGTIECFWRSGHLYQWEADNRNNKNGILKEVNDACYFSAPTANFFVVQAVGAGAGGYELHEEVEDFTEGGFYNPYPYTKTYHGFDLINSDGSKISIIHSLTTSDPGGISPYIPHDVFSKILLEDNNFGAGGRGDEITDFCTMPQGEYRVKSLYGESVYRDIRRTIDRTTHEQSSCDKSNIRRNYASAGGRGVIIISW